MSCGSGGGSAPVMLNPSEFSVPLQNRLLPNTLEPHIAAVLFETFLYGIYSVLFSICIYTLIRRRQFVHWILPVLTTVMFSIATADMVYSIVLHFRHVLKGALTFQDLRVKFWLHVTNNVLADSIFLYRCYVVWGGDLRVVALPILLFIGSIVCGYMFEASSSILIVFGKSWIYVILTFVLNVILTGLTAGRIWWLSWKTRKVLDRDSRKSYDVALATIIESGLLLALFMLPDLIVMSMILDYGFIQVVGIVPTLIVVQVGLGHAVNPVEASEATLEPLVQETAKRATSTKHRAENHLISFYTNGQSATVGSQGDDSRINANVLDCQQKSPQRDIKPKKYTRAGLRDPEKISESSSFLRISCELDIGEEVLKS